MRRLSGPSTFPQTKSMLSPIFRSLLNASNWHSYWPYRYLSDPNSVGNSLRKNFKKNFFLCYSSMKCFGTIHTACIRLCTARICLARTSPKCKPANQWDIMPTAVVPSFHPIPSHPGTTSPTSISGPIPIPIGHDTEDICTIMRTHRSTPRSSTSTTLKFDRSKEGTRKACGRNVPVRNRRNTAANNNTDAGIRI
jgi:hypothetical protein